MAIFAGIRSRYHFKQGNRSFESYIDDQGPMGPGLMASIRSFQKAVSLDSNYIEAWSSLGVSYYTSGMLAIRQPNLVIAEREYPEPLEMLSTEALLAFDLALDAYSKALNLLLETKINSAIAIAHHLRGKALVRLGDFQTALQEFTLAVECDSNHTPSSHNKAIVEELLQGHGTGLGAVLR